MKTIIRIILLMFFVGNVGVVVGEDYVTVNSGEWNQDGTWEQVDTEGTPGTTIRNQDGDDMLINNGHEVTADQTITINNNGFIFYIQGTLIINGNLDADVNDMTINVYDGGKIIIKNNLDVKNNLIINVEDGGQFIVDGEIDMDNNANLMIDGDLSAGSISGGNGCSITGDGNVYVEEGIEGVEDEDFTGTIIDESENEEGVIIKTDFNLSVPFDLGSIPDLLYDSEGVPNGVNSVELFWDYYNEEVPVGYEFLGFQIFRTLGEVDGSSKLTSETILMGNISEAGEFEGNGEISYTDEEISDEVDVFEKELTYYIRAVYKNNDTKNTEYKVSQVGTENHGVLPIELYEFSAEPNQSSVTINWATAAEINNDFFTIERSLDGINWSIIGYAQGAGDSNRRLQYDFVDNNPVEGISYYRLKQTDYDGQFEYFDPVAVQFGQNSGETKILNVASSNQNNIDVMINSGNFDAVLMVSDLQGRVLHRERINPTQNAQQVSVSLPGNNSGSILLISIQSSNEIDTKKVMIN